MKLTKISADIKLSSLILPGSWRKKLDADNLAALRKSLDEGAQFQPVRITTARHVVYGFHRIAATMDAGKKTIRADVAEYDTAAEQEKDGITENLQRLVLTKDEERRALARLVELRTGEIEVVAAGKTAQPAETADTHGVDNPQPAENLPTAAKAKTKPQSPRRQAIKRVAKETGRSEDTVERAMKEAAPAPPSEPPPPCVRTFGVPLPASVDGRARRVQATIDEADKHLRALAKLVNGLVEGGAPEKYAQAARNALADAADRIRGLRPESACPWCKGFANVAACYFCQGAGYADAERMKKDIPRELLLEGVDAMVADGLGKFRKVAGGAPAPAPKRGLGGRALTVEIHDDETGEVRELHPDDEEPPTPEEEPIF